jgi:hypothetical protein
MAGASLEDRALALLSAVHCHVDLAATAVAFDTWAFCIKPRARRHLQHNINIIINAKVNNNPILQVQGFRLTQHRFEYFIH